MSWTDEHQRSIEQRAELRAKDHLRSPVEIVREMMMHKASVKVCKLLEAGFSSGSAPVKEAIDEWKLSQ